MFESRGVGYSVSGAVIGAFNLARVFFANHSAGFVIECSWNLYFIEFAIILLFFCCTKIVAG